MWPPVAILQQHNQRVQLHGNIWYAMEIRARLPTEQVNLYCGWQNTQWLGRLQSHLTGVVRQGFRACPQLLLTDIISTAHLRHSSIAATSCLLAGVASEQVAAAHIL